MSQVAEMGQSKVQGQPGLWCEFEASLENLVTVTLKTERRLEKWLGGRVLVCVRPWIQPPEKGRERERERETRKPKHGSTDILG